MINCELYNDLMEFIPYEELTEILELTGFGEDETLADYVLFCNLAEKELNLESWAEYKDETENAF